jgi:hypothetical protein
MPTQMQMFYQEQRKIADLNALFMEMVKDGMTRAELQKLITKRPHVYGRFSNWLPMLP